MKRVRIQKLYPKVSGLRVKPMEVRKMSKTLEKISGLSHARELVQKSIKKQGLTSEDVRKLIKELRGDGK